MDGRTALLAVAMNGQALPVEHGFPARLVIPGLYGYVSACKWIVDINVTTFANNYAYWAQRGWSQQAPIKTESRIDIPGAQIAAGRTLVAGVAWAQHKGIDAVEVRIDNGPWTQAKLAECPASTPGGSGSYQWDADRGQPHRRGPRHRRHRIHADVRAGRAGAERRDRVSRRPGRGRLGLRLPCRVAGRENQPVKAGRSS